MLLMKKKNKRRKNKKGKGERNGSTFNCEGMCDMVFTEVGHSNLGGLGPDSGPKLLRFARVVSVKARSCDMVVTNTTPYSASAPSKNSEISNGMANINVMSGTSVRLKFDFVFSGTEESCEVPKFPLSVYDIDTHSKGQAAESVVVCNAKGIFNSDKSDLDKAQTSDGCTKLSATTGAADNPTSTVDLTDEQVARSFSALFTDAQTFDMELSVTPGGSGRNFMFAGVSAVGLVCPTTTTTTTTTTTLGKVGFCNIYSDPHAVGFDGRQVMARAPLFGTKGTVRLVKTPNFEIQALIDSDGLASKAVILFPGKQVVQITPHSVSGGDGLVQLYTPAGIAARAQEARGNAHNAYHFFDEAGTRFSKTKCLKFVQWPETEMCWVHYTQPHGFTRTIMCFALFLPKQSGITGMCGNYNGDPTDDTGNGLITNAAESYFSSGFTLLENSASTSDDDVPSVCADDVWKTKAKKACAHMFDEELKNSCMYDVCVTKTTAIAESEVAEEALDVEVARDIPREVVVNGKSGKCVDEDGKTYPVKETSTARDADDCQDFLRKAANPVSSGIIGAQFSEGSCELLGATVKSDVMVYSVDGESAWTCFTVYP